jgi:two-component system, OmpR family, response regulator
MKWNNYLTRPTELSRVVVVSDQPVFAATVVLTLKHGGYATQVAPTVPAATALVADWRPHLGVVAMDLGGDRLLAQLGLTHPGGGTTVPVLALTRRGDFETMQAAFRQGADDLMTVPFAPDEMLARALALTHRTSGMPASLPTTQRVGEVEFDILHRRIRVGGHELPLTSLEQSLLYLLAANADRVLSRAEIVDAVWGTDAGAEGRVVDHHVGALCAKFQDDWLRPCCIATVPGHGYRFLGTAPTTAAA